MKGNRWGGVMGLLFVFSTCYIATAQIVLPGQYAQLRWRMIGPHRGGRTVGAAGSAARPNEFFIGVNNGGVWKTTDYGRTWVPVFDDQPTGSIGDVAVAPSNPDVVYAASGEGLQRPDLSVGNGIYRSADGGKTWENTGLPDALQIGGLAIDPANENRVFVAALGHPYGANTERGVYRATDGRTWKRVLYIDENTGAIQVIIHPKNTKIIYADMWAGRLAPWENGIFQGAGSGLYKSIDGGDTWRKLDQGLPGVADGLGRIGCCIAPSQPATLYAVVDAARNGGLYRSDDAGKSWRMVNADKRLWDRGTDFAEVKVDPLNPEVVYVANVVTWKSVDGGKTFTAFRGAPGGDDYHRLWINPVDPKIILLASDQGAIITVNGGQTWSSWYNQPTAQFYHVSTDNAFPYNVYGGQQESGSVGIASRGNDGQITFREWHPVGAEEYGYVAADPKDPNIIYGGKISRFNKRTGQVKNIRPEASKSGAYRFLRTAPVLFSPVDNKTLFFAGNVLFATRDGGDYWKELSPDLSREQWDIPACIGIYNSDQLKSMPRRGVIYTVAPSNKNINTIWVGTDDGLIHLTRDGGKHWKNITPPEVTTWSKVSIIDAGHFDDNTAYAAVNRIRLDDLKPLIMKTHDGGKTWTKITDGLPQEPVNVVREDPFCKGLLYAGTENSVYVSFNDGISWQPLRCNMPATSIRDLVIKDNDLVIGTHGRSFWIMDNVLALRSLCKQQSVFTGMYPLADAYRVRWNMNTDTPLPQEEPAGENPPDGAMIDYYLPGDVAHIRLEITDSSGNIVRVFDSKDTLYTIPAVNIPLYWIRPQIVISGKSGAHRFVWDLRYTPLNMPPSYPISAIYGNTAPVPTSPMVLPGRYLVRLIADGRAYTQPLRILKDPRVTTTVAEMRHMHQLSMLCYKRISDLEKAIYTANEVQKGKMVQLKDKYRHLMNALQECDCKATAQQELAIANAGKEFASLFEEKK